jgi:hypothetical protein
MSDLQIALAVIGLLVVGGVYAFNLWQERRLRQRLERAFEGGREDVLLRETTVPVSPRIEPRLGGVEDPGTGAAQADTAEADPLIDFSADIELTDKLADAALRELQSQLTTFGKPTRLLGWDGDSGVWRVLDRGVHGDCRRLKAVLQLVSRSGPVHGPQLNGFCDALRAWAGRYGAQIEIDDTAAALQAARELDAFCGEMDVAIGLNVVAQAGAAFPGEQVAAAAAAAGFEFDTDGLFHWRDAEGQTLFTMENHEPEPFSTDRLATMQTPGLTLLLDVPRVADGLAVLDRMVRTGTMIAETLGGFVVDDNRVPLQEAGVVRIKTQLQEIYSMMAERQVPVGSQRAQRLFA